MSYVKLYNKLFDKYIWNCYMKIVRGGKVKANREILGSSNKGKMIFSWRKSES